MHNFYQTLGFISDLYPLYFSALLVFMLALAKSSFFICRSCFKGLKKKDFFIVFFLVTIAVILRARYTFHIDLDPYGWGYIRDALAVKDLFSSVLDSEYSLHQALHIPGYSYLIAFPLLFSQNIGSISGYNILFSVLTIFVVYLISYLLSENKQTSLIAAILVALSPLHIVFSGEEFPMSISVFFVTAQFLYFILWLKTKDLRVGLCFILLFFISLNIKIENIIFSLLFTILTIKELGNLKIRSQARIYLIYLFTLSAFSLIFWLPFFINLWANQNYTLYYASSAQSFFNNSYFAKHFFQFIVQMFQLFPVYVVVAYLVLTILRKKMPRGYIILGWFFSSLIYFFWYADIFSLWSMLQILIPIFIISGYLLTQIFRFLPKRMISLYIIAAALIIFVFSNSAINLGGLRRYFWVNLKEDLKTETQNACIVSPDLESSFSLPFLFPNNYWIFLNSNFSETKLSDCRGTIYYFNPVFYGLREEANVKKIANWEKQLRREYSFKKVNPGAFYKLVAKKK